jgi:arylsulfatase A
MRNVVAWGTGREVIAIVAVLLSGVCVASAAAADRPNFLVILCDDLGYGDLGCYGHPRIKTPNLDRLAGEGWRLTDYYAAAPVCSPSRAGMLTGRTPQRCGIYDWIPQGSPMHLRRSEVTVATLLKSAGYATCHVGKWHCNGKFNSPQQPQPGDHGFDYWFSTQNNAAPSHHNPVNFVRNGKPAGPIEGYSSQIIVDEALTWLRGRDTKQPFCLFVWFHAPHEPVSTAEDFVKVYSGDEPPERGIYYGNVTQMDHEVGRLLTAVDERGQRDNTLVWFASDNGPETLKRYVGAERSYGSPGQLRGMKLHMYEGGIRVPGIIRWPGKVQAGQVSHEPICCTDLMPTFCEIAGVKLPEGRVIDGASLRPAFEGKPVVRRLPLYWQYDLAISNPKIAMRQGDWKILADAALQRFELYNLADDSGETKDLVASQPDRLRSMSATLRTLHDQIKAEGPTWPPFSARPKPAKQDP